MCEVYTSQNVHKYVLVTVFVVLRDLQFDDKRLDITLVVGDDVAFIG